MVKNILVIDIGGSKILTALASVEISKTKVMDSLRGIQKQTLAPACGIDGVRKTITALVQQTLNAARCDLANCHAIGVTIPGVADAKTGRWVYAPFSGIRDYPIGDELRHRYGLPVFAENDVNACAWAEKIFGVCQGVNDFLWITISNGIGGGLVLNGRIHPGAFAGAAEMGHIVVVEGGQLCGCTHRGCLEAEAAGPAIAKRFTRMLEANRQLRESCSLPEVTAQTIAEAARNGNPAAIETFRTTGHLLGRAAAFAANIVNPEKIIFGGGVSQAFELFADEMKKTFTEQAFQSVNSKVTLERTGLGYEAGLYGAASLAVDA